MTITWTGKAFAGVINDHTNTYYTDPALNALLGQAEKFMVQIKGSNIQSTPTPTVSLEASNDGVNWTVRNSAVISGTALSSQPVQYGADDGTSTVGGRFARFGISFSGASSSAYVELWVTGRTAV